MGFFKTDQEKLQKRLRKARENRDADKMRQAIAEGARLDGTDTNHLYRAASDGFTEGVKLLLQHQADPHRAWGSSTPLMAAAGNGCFEIVALLLDAGVRTDAVDSSGETALHRAARWGRGPVIKLLLEKGADAGATDNCMNTPADLADKDHPRLADLIRSKLPPAVPVSAAPPPTAPEEIPAPAGWHLTADDEVSNITQKPAIGYSVTEIFNFGSGIYTRLAQNLKTGAESHSMRFFDEFPDHTVLDRARTALEKLGGSAAEGAASKNLDKPTLIAPPRGEAVSHHGEAGSTGDEAGPPCGEPRLPRGRAGIPRFRSGSEGL